MASIRFSVVKLCKNGMFRTRTESVVPLAVKILRVLLDNKSKPRPAVENMVHFFRSYSRPSSSWFFPRISQLKHGGGKLF